jgi:hypothetical protein
MFLIVLPLFLPSCLSAHTQTAPVTCLSTDLVEALYSDEIWYDAYIATWNTTTITVNWENGGSLERVQPYLNVRQRSTLLFCKSIEG